MRMRHERAEVSWRAAVVEYGLGVEIARRHGDIVRSGGAIAIEKLRRLSEQFAHAPDRGNEAVDFVAGVVERQRCSRRRRHAEELHQRMGTVMSATHGDTLVVEQRRQVVSVDAIDQE